MKGIALQDLHAQVMEAAAWFETVHAGQVWRYLSAGAGDETILLLHGGGGGPELMFRFLAAFCGSYRVIAPALPSGLIDVRAAVSGLRAVLD